MGRINDFLEIVVATPLLRPIFSGINSAFIGTISGLREGTQAIVGTGFFTNVVGKFNFFKK